VLFLMSRFVIWIFLCRIVKRQSLLGILPDNLCPHEWTLQSLYQ
jgi:hypothetical protein